MIFILLSWFFITCLSYCTGIGFHSLLKRITKNESPLLQHFTLLCISGLLVTSFLCTIISLVLPLSFISLFIIVAVSMLAAVLSQKNFRASIRYNSSLLKKTPLPALLVCTFFILIITRLSFIPSSHNDDGLYYSTSIKWLQEYGTVKGLANLNPRIAFNSTWLILQAQYSFEFLKAGLFNDLNGLLLIYLLIYACGGMIQLLKGNTDRFILLRALFILPALFFHHTASSDFMLFNVNFLSSPSADIPAALLLWFIVILFLGTKNETAESAVPFSSTDVLIIFYIISAITIKLIAIPMLLLILFYSYRLVSSKNWAAVLIMLAVCILPVIPWLIRNVLLSGYLLFPFSLIDWFTVDWKLPIENVYWHENAVKAFVVDAVAGQGNKHWIKPWLEQQTYMNTLLLLLITVSTITYLFIFLYRLLKRDIHFFKTNSKLPVTILTLLSGILFWFMKGPDFRFGYGYIVIYCALAISLFISYFLSQNAIYAGWVIAGASICVAFFIYKNDCKAALKEFTKPPLAYRLPQQMKQAVLNNDQKINLVNGPGIWNAPLPAATEEEFFYIQPVLRTNNMKDGFKAFNKKH